MTARLPVPGGDSGDWGTILNDYLEVSLNADGTMQLSAISAAGGVTTVNGLSPSSGAVSLATSNLSDTLISSPSINQVLTYNGTKWVNQASSGGVTLDTTSTDIVALGTQSAGSTGKAADAGHVHPTTGVQTAIIDSTVGDYTAVAQSTATGSTGKLADAGHVHQGVTSITAGSNVSVSGGDGSGHGALIINASSGSSTGGPTNVVATGGSAQTIPSPASYSESEITLSANITYTFPSLPSSGNNLSFLIKVNQPSGQSYTEAFPGGVIFETNGGTQPTAPSASSYNLYSVYTVEGTAWHLSPLELNGMTVASSGETPFIMTVDATNQGGTDYTTNTWMQLTNTGDNTNSGLTIDYYQYDGATQMRFAPNNWGNGKGFIIEYAPDENILIFGAVYGTGQFPVSTYMDGSNIFHFAAKIATDGEPYVYVAAPTAGGFSWQMPFGGNNYKKLMVSFGGYENDTATNQVYNLTTGGYGANYISGFTNTPYVTFNSTGLSVSLSGATITIVSTNSTTTYSGLVIFEGS